MSKKYDLNKIRTLLIEGFTDANLRAFCFYDEKFRPVHSDLAANMGLSAIAHEIIQYACRQSLLDELLDWAKQENPTKYSIYEPYFEYYGLAELYQVLKEAIQQKNWDKAITLCQEIESIQHGYKDVKELWKRVEEEQKLAELYQALQEDARRKAWSRVKTRCDEIERIRIGYRNVSNWRRRAERYQQKGTIPRFLLQLQIPLANHRRISIMVIIGSLAASCTIMMWVGFPPWFAPTPTPTTEAIVYVPTSTSTLTPSPTPTATSIQPTPSTPATVEPSAIILSPTEGAEVGLMTQVTGKSLNLPSDQHLWLLVETNQNDGYYPQFGPIEPDIDGQWQAMIRVGANDAFNVSLPFTITLALADDKVSQEFTDFVKNWSPGQIGLPRPETGLVPETSIHVTRHIPYVTVLSPASGSKVIRFQTIEGTYDNLEPGLWHLYGAVANGADRFKPFGPFTPESLSGRWKVEVEFSWPEDGSRQVAFNGLVVLAGSLVDQRLQIAIANGTYLTQADLMDDWPSVFNSGGEPLAQTTFTLAERIAFASDKPGNDDIFVINADGTGLKRLTEDAALDDEPAWSPDGRQIVFVSRRLGTSQLFVMDADGDQQRPLISDHEISGHQPNWSPDGQWIAFYSEQDDNIDIYKVRSDGTDLTRLTQAPEKDLDPEWSPDSKYILFLSERDKNESVHSELYVMDADGGNQTQLTRNNIYEDDAVWSPDGTKILFIRDYEGNRDVSVMNADGTEVRLAATRDYDRHPSFAPDGERFVFDSSVNNRQLFLATLTSPNKPAQIQTGLGKSFNPAWSSVLGDERIAFVGRYDGDWEIYTMWEDGQEQKQLLANCWNEVQPRISPDGRWLVFASDAAGDFNSQPEDAACLQDRNYNIWRLDLTNPAQMKQLTNSSAKEWQPAWSPNGKQVAFTSDEAGNFDIYMMNADGTGRFQLTTDPAEDSRPAWRSDTQIVFFSERTGQGDIYQVNAAGGEATPLVQNPNFDGSPAVSPNGQILIFASGLDTQSDYATELYALNLVNGELKRLTENDSQDTAPLWSGDGRLIFFTSDRDGAENIWVMGADGSKPVNLIKDTSRDYFLGNP